MRLSTQTRTSPLVGGHLPGLAYSIAAARCRRRRGHVPRSCDSDRSRAVHGGADALSRRDEYVERETPFRRTPCHVSYGVKQADRCRSPGRSTDLHHDRPAGEGRPGLPRAPRRRCAPRAASAQRQPQQAGQLLDDRHAHDQPDDVVLAAAAGDVAAHHRGDLDTEQPQQHLAAEPAGKRSCPWPGTQPRRLRRDLDV